MTRGSRRIGAEDRPTLAELEESIRTGRTASIELLVIERKPGHDVIGYCGLVPDAHGPGREPELAFELLRSAWGRGYATEASLAVLERARSSGHARLSATVRDWNTASLRVLGEARFRRVGSDGPGLGSRHLRSHVQAALRRAAAGRGSASIEATAGCRGARGHAR